MPRKITELSDQEKKTILDSYDSGNFSARMLADIFFTSERVINRVIEQAR